MLIFDQVSKSYKKGAVKAVDDLSLHVRPGEIFGFLGPNGAGKTTTIKMAVGLLRADAGRITVSGFDIVKEPLQAKSAIGFVPDNPDLYERLTGLEYLNFIADVYRVPADLRRKRMERLLEMFELTSAIGDLVQGYSHGMQQKLALTGAWLHDPNVLILDEPMVGLDPRSAHLTKDLMREHCDRGKTVFFSTHVLEVAEKLCDRIGIINKGKLIACGTMEELRTQAKNQESLENIFLELTE
ncbi:MAG: ABC transporter ATP-binding protein [Firmicutes bacterium]|nr:ABC transporter ATP-binding protein [Bacillota bacterium]